MLAFIGKVGRNSCWFFTMFFISGMGNFVNGRLEEILVLVKWLIDLG
jgi:hypothetical protein